MQDFLEDKSGFKSKIFIVILIAFVSFLGSFILNTAYFDKVTQNNNLEAQYSSQSHWLQKFDFKDASALYAALLKPCKAADLDKIQNEQLGILQKNNLKILSVKNEPAKKVKGKVLSSQKSTVVVSGSWADLQQAIAEFEKVNLVIIVDANITTDKEGLKAKLEYQTYYI